MIPGSIMFAGMWEKYLSASFSKDNLACPKMAPSWDLWALVNFGAKNGKAAL